MAAAPHRRDGVFLNVPYDLRYERLFVALIARVSGNLEAPGITEIESIYVRLNAVVPDLKRKFRSTTVFEKPLFDELRSGATALADKLGLFKTRQGE